jgi:hypothetical protein
MKWFRRNKSTIQTVDIDKTPSTTSSSVNYVIKEPLKCILCGAHLECLYCGSQNIKNGKCENCGAPQK